MSGRQDACRYLGEKILDFADQLLELPGGCQSDKEIGLI